ncbi:BQ2448_1848 [Microbotryum intermedium]|uniref:BQ2448_1848 protein n=1 Tax=Microbotryum intermedium TaxID=269621 RepID=A0A238FF03_9BASI|nr:BQ2448_1848 [Microbotryum intermedium]
MELKGHKSTLSRLLDADDMTEWRLVYVPFIIGNHLVLGQICAVQAMTVWNLVAHQVLRSRRLCKLLGVKIKFSDSTNIFLEMLKLHYASTALVIANELPVTVKFTYQQVLAALPESKQGPSSIGQALEIKAKEQGNRDQVCVLMQSIRLSSTLKN